jgi:enterochelin esterase-like enzyme
MSVECSLRIVLTVLGNLMMCSAYVRNFGCLAILGLMLIHTDTTSIFTKDARAIIPRLNCDVASGTIGMDSIPNSQYGAPVTISVYLPPCYDTSGAPLAVIYLLHGANTDQTQWPDLRVQESADAVIAESHIPFVVVMPGGAYRNDFDYGAFVLTDLIPAIEQRYNVRKSGEGRAIGGLSMGAYWALKVAFQHPELFAAVGGHSPVVAGYGSDDPLELARTMAGLNRLRITLDAGDSDPLRYDAARLTGVLTLRSIPVTFSINPGGHNRPYWRAHSEEYLRFYAESFTSYSCSQIIRHRW